MPITWTVKQDGLLSIISRFDARADLTVQLALNEITTDVQDHSPVDTGAMKAGYYNAMTGPAQGQVRSGDDLKYPWFVEFGHRTRGGGGMGWVPAQPHFVPAFDRARGNDVLVRMAQATGLFEP